MSSNPQLGQLNRRRMERRVARKSTVVSCRKGALGLGEDLAVRLKDVSIDGAQLVVKAALKTDDEVELVFSAPGFHYPLVQTGAVRMVLA